VASRDPRGTPTIPVTHPAFWVSCILGALGLLLILIGLVVGGAAVFDVGVFAGFASLVSALAWRADLVAAWRKEHPRARNNSL
jgi:hypothetical protein